MEVLTAVPGHPSWACHGSCSPLTSSLMQAAGYRSQGSPRRPTPAPTSLASLPGEASKEVNRKGGCPSGTTARRKVTHRIGEEELDCWSKATREASGTWRERTWKPAFCPQGPQNFLLCKRQRDRERKFSNTCGSQGWAHLKPPAAGNSAISAACQGLAGVGPGSQEWNPHSVMQDGGVSTAPLKGLLLIFHLWTWKSPPLK